MTKMTLGRPDRVELQTTWNLDPLLNMITSVCSSTGSKRFPQSIELTTIYEDRTIVWSCFQTEEWAELGKTYDDILDEWMLSDIDLIPVGHGETIWRKEMFGLVFAATSITMERE
jgi:hypothetical protein